MRLWICSATHHVMTKEVRKSSISNISVGNTLGCVRPDGTSIDFTVSGGNLDMAVDGTFSMRLIRGQAVSLGTRKNTARSVELTLNLLAGDDPSRIVSTIYVRN